MPETHSYERAEITPEFEEQIRRIHGPNKQGSFPGPDSHLIISLLDERNELLESINAIDPPREAPVKSESKNKGKSSAAPETAEPREGAASR